MLVRNKLLIMEEKDISKSCQSVLKTRDESLCAMYFGISCSLVALKYLSKKALSETRDEMLQETARLLGLLVWEVQKEVKDTEKSELLHKLEAAESEIRELKMRRSEDGKANERVASIYAAREQGWSAERRQLQSRTETVLNDLRRKDKMITDLNARLTDMEVEMKSKDKMLEEGEKKRKELEEKVKVVEGVMEGLKESCKKEAQHHSDELMKHKKAFFELISNQRQLKAELGRSIRQVEGAKKQIEFVFEEKEEAVSMVQRLSIEMERMRFSLEHKDEVLRTMMRKPKLDSEEKQRFSKEVKLWKHKGGKDEVETERTKRRRRRRTFSGFRSEKTTLRSMLSRQLSSRFEVFSDLDGEFQKQEDENFLNLEQNLSQVAAIDGTTRLNEWVESEAEKYQNAIQRQHQLELDAFSEQIRVKDDKLDVYRWQLKNTELESKRLQSQIEGLNQDMSQLRRDNLKLESLLLDREVELKTLKDRIGFQLNSLSCSTSKVHITERRQTEKEEETVSTVNTEEKEVIVESNPACIRGQWKVYLHALGVSYKIKRLSQQLVMLDRLTGNIESQHEGNDKIRTKGFVLLMMLLKKQVTRYQSLQQKTDDLSQRMGDKDLYEKKGESSSLRTKEETKSLQDFLEETFQLQRFIVATGQKLMELQSKIATGFIGISEDLDVSDNFDMKRFSSTIQALFRDIQRGLEVRIARIIGDLEGTLARDGIHSWKH